MQSLTCRPAGKLLICILYPCFMLRWSMAASLTLLCDCYNSIRILRFFILKPFTSGPQRAALYLISENRTSKNRNQNQLSRLIRYKGSNNNLIISKNWDNESLWQAIAKVTAHIKSLCLESSAKTHQHFRETNILIRAP